MLRSINDRLESQTDERRPIVESASPPEQLEPPPTPPTPPAPPSKHLLPRLFPSLGWRFQKVSTYAIIAVFYLFGGLEYGVVLPSLWQFLDQRFGIGDDGAFLGLTMAAFSATSLVCSPFVGLVIDRLSSAKPLLLFGCLASIVGNSLYFLAFNKWLVFWGRVLCGAGWSCRPALLTDITRTTTPEERTGIITIIMVFPQLGYLAGPAVNLVLANFDFWIFYHTILVDKYSGAGFFSAFLFILLGIVSCFFYFNLQEVRLLEKSEEEAAKAREMQAVSLDDSNDSGAGEQHAKQDENTKKVDSTAEASAVVSDSLDETFDASSAEADATKVRAREGNVNSACPPFRCLFDPRSWDLYIYDEIIVTLCLVFTSTLSLVSIETAAFPLMDFLFGWTIIANSMFGSIACGAVIAAYFVLHRISKKYDDRTILLVIQTIGILSILWLMAAYGQAMNHSDEIISNRILRQQPLSFAGYVELDSRTAWQFLVLVGFAFFFISVPCITVTATSLLSKLLEVDRQGIGQGSQQVITSLANVVGPLWAGAMLWKNIYVLFGIEIVLYIVALFMFLGSWRRLKPEAQT